MATTRKASVSLFGVESEFRPIEVDSLQGSGNIKITDRVKFNFNYTQDTWSGATPIATAPLDLRGNRTVSPNARHRGDADHQWRFIFRLESESAEDGRFREINRRS